MITHFTKSTEIHLWHRDCRVLFCQDRHSHIGKAHTLCSQGEQARVFRRECISPEHHFYGSMNEFNASILRQQQSKRRATYQLC